MNELFHGFSNKETKDEEARKRHADEVKKFHLASVNAYSPGTPEEEHFLDWERTFEKRTGNSPSQDGSTESDRQETDRTGKEGGFDDAAGRIQQVFTLIDLIELSPESSGDEQMERKLNEDKSTAKKMIKNLVSGDVRDYAALVGAFDKARIDTQERKITVEDLKDFDQRRQIKHDALISSIKIVNRFLTQKFGEMGEDELEQYIENEEKAGRAVADVRRVKWPRNIICPDYVTLASRESITDWAMELSRSFSELHL